jgi:hypothetical protein
VTKQPLTPKQKEDNRHRANLLALCNSITNKFSFGKIKKWTDVYVAMGMLPQDFPANHETPITFPELKAYLQSLKDKLEARLAGVTVKPEQEPAPKAEGMVATPAPPSNSNFIPKLYVPPPEKKAEPLQVLGAEENYGFKPSPNEKTFYYWFQKKSVVELYNGIVVEQRRAMLLLAGTGMGKTFISLGFVRRLVDMKFADEHTFGAILYLYVTRATIVEQTKRVAKKYFNLSPKDGFEIVNIEQLRSKAGAQWVKERMEIVNGQEVFTWEWRNMLNPVVIIWDESQGLKNDTSIQHKIGVSFNEIKTPIFQVFMSATPFTRVCEAKCFAVATRKNISDTLGTAYQSYISNATWPTYASSIAGSQSKPDEYNEAAVERLVKDLEPYMVRVRGVRPQYGADNKVEVIPFQSPEAAAYYQAAWERWLKEKQAAEAKEKETGEKESGLDRLTRDLKFRMAAEYVRADIIGERMYQDVQSGRFAAVSANNFKGTVIGIVKYLIEKRGVSRDQITLVWGGGKTGLTKKEKASLDVLKKAEQLLAAGITQDEIFKMLDIEPEDLIRAQEKEAQELPESYRLGGQSKEERQIEIDKFQSGKTLYCIFTMRSGGVGLSLHHSDEFSPIKVRRKESGYAFEEDISNVPIRPRRNYVAPTYSAIELVQALGRCPRLTSLSVTEQILLFYSGTIEVNVAAVTNTKLGCLGKVVRQKEDWMDILDSRGESAKKHMSQPDATEVDEESGELEEGEDEE